MALALVGGAVCELQPVGGLGSHYRFITVTLPLHDCFTPALHHRLQLADGTVYQGKRYRGSELTASTFDPATEMPDGFEVTSK